MGLVEEWRRRVAAGAGAGVIAPAAVVAAAVAVGVGGGVRGLGALAQAVNGPVIPDDTAAATPAARDEARADADLLARAHGRRDRAVRRAVVRSAVASDRLRRVRARSEDSDRVGRAPRRDGSRQPARGNRPPEGGPAPGGGSRPPGQRPPGQQPPPEQPPQERPGLIRQAGDTVQPVVRQVPVAGPTGAEVVGEMVDAADAIVPPPGRTAEKTAPVAPVAAAPAAADGAGVATP